MGRRSARELASDAARRERERERDLVARVGDRIGVDLAALGSLSERDRAEALEELKLLDAAFKRNPLLGYRPHGQQQRFHGGIGLSLRAFFGGNRAGKTTAGVADSLIQTVDRECVPEHLLPYRRFEPPFFCRVVTPDLGNKLEVVTNKIREWCPADQIRGGAFERGYDKVLRVLHFRNGSWWQFNSNDQDRDKLGGDALHRVFYDEEPRQYIRNECIVRLIDFDGDEIFCMTPFSGMSWLYDDVYEPWQRGDLPPLSVTIADMEDNPHLNPEAMERVLAGFSKEEREARKGGRFVHFAGLIYGDDWKPATKHLVPALAPESLDGEVYVGIDPGLRNAAVVWCLLGEDDQMVVFDELLLKRDIIAHVCRAIHERNAYWGVEPRWYVIDPASRNKNNQTGKSDQQEFIDNGIVPIPGQHSVQAGIQRVKARLQADPPRLVVTADCAELRREFERYRWRTPKRVEDDPKDAPVKTQDHLLDALRYVCMQRPLRPEPARPFESLTLKDRLTRHMLAQQGLRGRVPEGTPGGPGYWQ